MARDLHTPRFRLRLFVDDSELCDDDPLIVLGSHRSVDVLIVNLPHEVDDLSQERLIKASAEERIGEVETLLGQPVCPNFMSQGSRALCSAARSGSLQCLALLLEARAEVDLPDGEGFTSLHLAAEMGCPGVAKLLLEASADADNLIGNLRDSLPFSQEDSTALHLSAMHGHTEVVRLLLDARAQFFKREDGESPLHCGAANGHAEAGFSRRLQI